MESMLEMMKARRSVREYTKRAVSQKSIDKIVEAGLFAASGMGKQSPIIIAVTDPEVRDQLSRANAEVMGSDIDPFYGAPVVLVVLANKKIATNVYDGSLVLGNMMLEAFELGLGSCWIHRAKEVFEGEVGKALLAKLGIEGEYEGIGHLIIGWPKEETPAEKPRKEGRVFQI